MPPLPNMPNVLQLRLLGGDDDTFKWENVLHYIYSGAAPSLGDLTLWGTDLAAAWLDQMAPLCSENTVLTSLQMTDLTSPTSAQQVFPTAITGSRVGADMAANAAVLISYPSAYRYRGGHPRQYVLAGVAADLLDPAHWSDSFVALMTDAWTAFTQSTDSETYGGTTIVTQCFVSYYNRILNPVKPYRRAIPIAVPIASSLATANSELSSQRGRIGRRR